jgi:hypothetical protein
MSVENFVLHRNLETVQTVEGEATEGGVNILRTADKDNNELLERVLTELRIINLRQQEAFQENVDEGDL